VKVDRPSRPQGQPETQTVKSLDECDPGDLFEKAFEAFHGQRPSADHRIAFESIRAGD
jgi:hypothetical protein